MIIHAVTFCFLLLVSPSAGLLCIQINTAGQNFLYIMHGRSKHSGSSDQGWTNDFLLQSSKFVNNLISLATPTFCTGPVKIALLLSCCVLYVLYS